MENKGNSLQTHKELVKNTGASVENNIKNENKTESSEPRALCRQIYFFKEKCINETTAFTKYYQAINENGFILKIIEQVEDMGDFCDLFNDVPKDYDSRSINLYCESLPTEERNEYILYASRYLSLVHSKNKGRSLVSGSEIPRNKILIYETPTVLQVTPLCACVGDRYSSLYRCHNCGTACRIFYTCEGCNICIFCSRNCLIYAYKNYHKYECYGLQRHFWSMEDTDYSYLAMRMMLYGATRNFESDPMCNVYGSYTNNYPFIYKLEGHFERLSWVKLNKILYSCVKNLVYLIKKTTFFHQFNVKNCQLEDLYLYIGGLMVKHYCQAQINNILLKYPNLSAGFGCNVISGSGKAICPTIALLNHSCSPNAAILMYNDSIVVKSTRTIKKGEEVTICYSEVNALLTVAERQIITHELFFFICNCFFCYYERNWAEAPYRCSLCHVGKARREELSDNKSIGYCTRCHHFFSLDKITETLKKAKICKNLYHATYSIDHVTRLAEYYRSIFPKNSWHLMDVYKLLYEKYVLCSDKPLETMKYGLLTFSILEHYISRLYLPILLAKVKFTIQVLSKKHLSKIKKLTDDEFETMRHFVAEVMQMKEDLLFYISEERIGFFQELLLKVHDIFESMETN